MSKYRPKNSIQITDQDCNMLSDSDSDSDEKSIDIAKTATLKQPIVKLSQEAIIEKLKGQALRELEINKKPDEVQISTMTVTCRLPTKFLCDNIAYYVDLKHNGILSVTCGIAGDPKTNRSIIYKKKASGKKKKTRLIFFNQVSMYITVKGKKNKPVNAKIFSNGSIQMTGCLTIDNAIEVLTKILPELRNVKAIVDYKTKTVIEKPFATDIELLTMDNIFDFKVAMINSNFVMPLKIDRPKLYNLMLAEGYECLYDPNKHACVNIKFEHPDKTISVFVFENGPIIITGARNCDQILCAYNFINKYLLTHVKAIVKNDGLTNSSIIKYLESV